MPGIRTAGCSPMVGVILSHELKARVDSEAKADGRTVSNFVRQLIVAHFAAKDAKQTP